MQQGGKDCTLLLLDIDNFKSVNDTFGHSVGDDVLQAVAQALQQDCKEGEVGRWGGEEFLVILPPVSARKRSSTFNKLQRCLQPTAQVLPSGKPVTLSGGSVRFSEAATLPQLLTLADQRLYAAKRLGRNRIAWDDRHAESQPNPPLRTG